MEKTNLQQLLSTLTKPEWRDLGDFLASPYFNKNEKFRRFYQALTPYHPGFAFDEGEKKRIYTDATLLAEWNDAGYRNLCSDFLDLIQQFIVQQVIATGNTQKEMYLNRDLISRGLLTLAEKNLKKIRNALTQSQKDAGERLRAQVWINDLQIMLGIRSNRTKIHHASNIMLEDKSYRTNTELMLLKAFVSFNNYVSASQNKNQAIDRDRLQPYLDLYIALAPFENVEVELNYLLLRMSTETDDHFYHACKTRYIEQLDSIHGKDKSNVLSALINHVNAQVSTNEQWREEVFQLHDLKLSKRLWTNHDDLGYVTLFNAVQNALQLDRIAYAEQILVDYAPFLNQQIRKSIVHLCKGWISLFKGDFDQAHEEITHVETENNLIKYEIRSLQALVFYEQNAWDLLSANLESFRQFIQYNKADISADVTETYLAFVKQLQLLTKLPPSPTAKQRSELIAVLSNDGHGYLKPWLLQKAAGK